MDKVMMVPLVLREGGVYKIEGKEWIGHPLSVLQEMGFDKSSLKKAAKAGLCHEMFAPQNSKGTLIRVYVIPSSGQIII